MADFQVGDHVFIHNCDCSYWNGNEAIVTKLIEGDDMAPFCCYIDVALPDRQHPYEIAVASYEIRPKGGPW